MSAFWEIRWEEAKKVNLPEATELAKLGCDESSPSPHTAPERSSSEQRLVGASANESEVTSNSSKRRRWC